MGKWVNNGKVSIPSSHSFGSDGDILEELGPLLGVGKRSNGQFYLADMCAAPSIKKWAKFKPNEISKEVNITEDDRKTVNQGFSLEWTNNLNMLVAYARATSCSWQYIKVTGRKRVRDFNGYNHSATLTPYKMITTTGEEGIVGYNWTSADVVNSTIIPLACNFTIKAGAEIQPDDLIAFGDSATHRYIYGVIVTNTSFGSPQICKLSSNKSDGFAQNGRNYIEMPLKPTSDKRFRYSLNASQVENPAYFSIPYNSVTSSFYAILCVIRQNKVTGDESYMILPTEKLMSFKYEAPITAITMRWEYSTSVKSMRVITAGNGSWLTAIKLRLIVGNLEKYAESNTRFKMYLEVYMNGNSSRSLWKEITSDDYQNYVVESHEDVVTMDIQIASDVLGGGPPILPDSYGNPNYNNFDVRIYMKSDAGDASSPYTSFKMMPSKSNPQYAQLFEKVEGLGSYNPLGDLMTYLGTDNYSIENLH